MFKALLKTRFASFTAALLFKSGGKTNQKSSKGKYVLFALLMLYACFAFMSMFGLYFHQIAKPFFELGIGWLYFTLFAMTAFALMFIGSIFMSKSQLYEARDNELLLSLPIPPQLILGSRMVILMALNFLLELLVAIPAFVMWVRAVQVSPAQIVFFVLIFLSLPFFAMAFSGLFGWLIALSTGRVRNKSLMTMLFSIIFLGAYFFFFSQANVYIQKLVTNGTAIAGSLGSVTPLYWVGNAIAGENLPQLILTLIIMLLPFALMYYLLTVTFIRVATARRGAAKIKYEEKAMHSTSASSALLRREIKHMLSSPNYMLNAGIGVLFTVAAAVAIIIKKAQILSLLAQMGAGTEYAAIIAVFGLCLFACTILFSASSVSLEGKSLWIVKSLPVSSREVLDSKLHMHVYITAPAVLLASLAAVYVTAPSLLIVAAIFLAPLFFILLTANLGLICNLKSPRFDWINETVVVKQSMSVMLAMLFSFLLAGVPAGLYFGVFGSVSPTLYTLGYTIFLAIGWLITRKWINTKGVEIFDGLS